MGSVEGEEKKIFFLYPLRFNLWGPANLTDKKKKNKLKGKNKYKFYSCFTCMRVL